MKIDDLLVERACIAAVNQDEGAKATWFGAFPEHDRAAFRKGMRAALEEVMPERDGEPAGTLVVHEDPEHVNNWSSVTLNYSVTDKMSPGNYRLYIHPKQD